jgi:hypothetical protein
LVFALSLPSPASPQADSSTLHATLSGWADQTWYLLTDRGAAEGGRLGDRGILQRFHPDIDAEYELDLISSQFGLTDEYAWQRQSSGVRYWAGSVNLVQLVDGADFKAATNLGRGWSFRAQYAKQTTPAIDRDLLHVGVERSWATGARVFAEGSLHAFKPDGDLAIGGGWSTATADVQVSLTMLDAFNDFVYQVLEVWPGFAETAIDHERQPFAVRGSLNLSPIQSVRLSADAGILLQSRFRSYDQREPERGFRQSEQYAHAGGVFEFSIVPRLRTGVMGTYVRAMTDREPLSAGEALDDYSLLERTAQMSAFVLADLAPRWRVEAWIGHTWRPEKRDYGDADQPDVDYEDRAWSGAASGRYRAPGGFRADLAFEIDSRSVIRGDEQVPRLEFLDRNNSRVRLGVGWQFGQRFSLDLGFRLDVDGDTYTDHGRFDGAHGRFVMRW